MELFFQEKEELYRGGFVTEKGKKRRKKDGSETVCASSPSQSPSPSDFVHVREMLTKIDDHLFLSDCSI